MLASILTSRRPAHKNIAIKARCDTRGDGRLARVRSPAADDLDGVVATALLVSAFPAHREAALAQRRPAETQLIVVKELGLLHKKRTSGGHTGPEF